MFMSSVDRGPVGHVSSELAGARVLVAARDDAQALHIANEFSYHHARLVVLTSPAFSREADARRQDVEADLKQRAASLSVIDVLDGEPATPAVQEAAAELGGFDIVVTVSALGDADLARVDAGANTEEIVAAALRSANEITRVAANRMNITWAEGTILNALIMAQPSSGRAGVVADVARAMLGDLTRGQAEEWADKAVRINAIAPQSSVSALLDGPQDTDAADIAKMAVALASNKSRSLTGHVVELSGAFDCTAAQDLEAIALGHVGEVA